MTRAKPVFFLCMALLYGCASTNNLATDGDSPLGGGYLESKVRDGVFYVRIKTNWAPWVNTLVARSSWRDHAKALCGSDRFRELDITERHYKAPGVPYIMTRRDGFAVCENVKLSDDEVLALIYGQR